MKFIWVTKFVTRKDWEESYRYNQSYALIDKVRGGYRIGFLLPRVEMVDGKMPVDISEANEFDIKEIKKWRERNNVSPR